MLRLDDTVIFDEVSRMSRNADKCYSLYNKRQTQKHIEKVSSRTKKIDNLINGIQELVAEFEQENLKDNIRLTFEQVDHEERQFLIKRVTVGKATRYFSVRNDSKIFPLRTELRITIINEVYITVGNQVWTLDANGAWDGKSATTAFVSSSLPSGRNPGSTSTGNDDDGNNEFDVSLDSTTNTIVISGGDSSDEKIVDSKKLKDKLKGTTLTLKDVTIKIDTPDVTLTGGEDVNNPLEIASLTITEKVGDGSVDIENIKVSGETEIKGGGGDSNIARVQGNFKAVTLKDCKFIGKVTTNKSSEKPLIISFVGKTNVETIEANGTNVEMNLAETVTVANLSTYVSITLSGKGGLKNFTVKSSNSDINVVVNVMISEKMVVEGGGKTPNIKVGSEGKVLNPIEKPENVIISGEGTVAGYYNIILDANGGYWEIGSTEDEAPQSFKVENGKSISTVIGVTGFKYPKNKTPGKEVFDGWYREKDNSSTKVENLNALSEGITLYAGWTDQKVEVTSAKIEGIPEVGKTLTVKLNDDPIGQTKGQPTGKPTYEWYFEKDGSFESIPGATNAFYTIESQYVGRRIKVKVKGDVDSSVYSNIVGPIAAETPESGLTIKTVDVRVATATNSAINISTDKKISVKVSTGGAAGLDIKNNQVVDSTNATVKVNDVKVTLADPASATGTFNWKNPNSDIVIGTKYILIFKTENGTEIEFEVTFTVEGK